jgi:hypothetical protein
MTPALEKLQVIASRFTFYFGIGVSDAILQMPDESLKTLSLARESLIH